MSRVEVKTRPLKRVEYERLVEGGFFRPGDPVELVGGQLLVAEPQGSRHFGAIRAVEEALRPAFGPGWEVRAQAPLALDDESEPEPDVAVVPGSFRDYVLRHPSQPALLIEVSDSSLALDRHHKGSLYARAGIPEVWLLVVGAPGSRTRAGLEVYRQPSPRGYRDVLRLRRGDRIAPLALPDTEIAVADLLGTRVAGQGGTGSA